MLDLPATLPDAIARAARQHPDRGIRIFDARGRRSERRTYPELRAAVERGAVRLRAAGLAPGDRVLVALPASWDWVEAWLGAVWLGALPAAVAPPGTLGGAEGYASRIARLVARTGARRLVCGAGLRSELRREQLDDCASRAIAPEELAALAPEGRSAPHASAPEDVAFLQFTSGSTGLPRAARIPHRAVLHNGAASDEAIGAPWGAPASRFTTAVASWLPLHHDMGLVGCLFLSFQLGLELSLLGPTAFLARPRLWLEALAAAGTTFAPAPNFGYQLCVERLAAADVAGLDLSGWRAALTGAEMVRPETAEEFAALLAPTGFRRESMRPCYGLAEATLAVTFDRRGHGVRTAPIPDAALAAGGPAHATCVGEPVRDTELRIAAPDGTALPERTVGEVRVRGPAVFAGYHDDAEATQETLRDGWLCTGDLGFRCDGELYLTGRLKDILILRGENVMPHELEWLAEGVTGGGGALRSGAFSVTRGAAGEEPVLVVEAERDADGLADLGRAIRLRVAHALGLALADVAFVRRGTIPKTSSGKVRRQELRRRYLANALERLA